MSWINEHIILRDNQDLNIHWDSKPEKEYLNDKKNININLEHKFYQIN